MHRNFSRYAVRKKENRKDEKQENVDNFNVTMVYIVYTPVNHW